MKANLPLNQILTGHVLEVLRKLPADSVHSVVTSPPYYGLRDYGTVPQVWGGKSDCSHRWKDLGKRHRGGPQGKTGELATRPSRAAADAVGDVKIGRECTKCRAWEGSLGLEPTPGMYLDHLVEIFREVRRVLREDGTVWLNIGDSYTTAGTRGGNSGGKLGDDRVDAHRRFYKPRNRKQGIMPKNLHLIPQRLAIALQEDGWYVRLDVIWEKPNPLPDSATDRPSRSHEYLWLLSKSSKYYFDMEPIKEKAVWAHEAKWDDGSNSLGSESSHAGAGASTRKFGDPPTLRNKRSVWTITCIPFPDAHFAVYPEDLVVPCILAGTSEKGVCAVCGAPWERLIETKYVPSPKHGEASVVGRKEPTGQNNFDGAGMPRLNKLTRTKGWAPSCECKDAVPGPAVVLDPFMGAGTTGLVARKLGRHWVGIELSPEYARLAEGRINASVSGPRPRPLSKEQKKAQRTLFDE